MKLEGDPKHCQKIWRNFHGIGGTTIQQRNLWMTLCISCNVVPYTDALWSVGVICRLTANNLSTGDAPTLFDFHLTFLDIFRTSPLTVSLSVRCPHTQKQAPPCPPALCIGFSTACSPFNSLHAEIRTALKVLLQFIHVWKQKFPLPLNVTGSKQDSQLDESIQSSKELSNLNLKYSSLSILTKLFVRLYNQNLN